MAKKTTGFGVYCPHCLSRDCVRIDLNDLTDVNCESCGESFSPRGAAELFAERAQEWLAVMRWVDMAPSAKADPTEDDAPEYDPNVSAETREEWQRRTTPDDWRP